MVIPKERHSHISWHNIAGGNLSTYNWKELFHVGEKQSFLYLIFVQVLEEMSLTVERLPLLSDKLHS